MGADGGHRPRPMAQDPVKVAPCDGEPRDAPWDNVRPKLPRAAVGAQQVSDPARYAVVGKVLLAAAGAFAGILLALVALHIYTSSRRRRRRTDGRRRMLLRSLAIAGGGDEDSRDGGAAPSPRGLDPAVLRALPVAAAGAGAGDCAVCLAELEPGEKARALPRCGHRFHVECIDAWFRGNSTCPLCRADVVAPDGGAAEEEAAQPEVRIDVSGADAAAAKGSMAAPPAMGRLPSGTNLEKTRRVFASIRSASF